MANLDDFVTSLVDWEANSLTQGSSRLKFLSTKQRLQEEGMDPDRQDAVLQAFSARMKTDIVENGKQGVYKFESDLTKADKQSQGSFEQWSEAKRAQVRNETLRNQQFSQKQEALDLAESQMAEVNVLIGSSVVDGLEALDAALPELKSSYLAGGLSEGEATKLTRKYEKLGVETAFHTINDQDPKSAIEFVKSNAGLLGDKAPNLLRNAQNTLTRLEAQSKEMSAKEIRTNMLDWNIDQIKGKQNAEGIEGEVARKLTKQINNDPFKVIEPSLNVLNVNDPASLVVRANQIQDAEDKFSTPNLPINIPLLGSTKVEDIVAKAKLDVRFASKTLDFLSSLDAPTTLKMAREFEDNPLGQALRIYKTNPALAKDIILGHASEDLSRIKKIDLQGTDFYADPAANNAAKSAIMAVSKVRNYTTSEAESTVGGLKHFKGSGIFGKKTTLPAGVTGDVFGDTMDRLLANPKELVKFASGKPAGGDEVLSLSDVDVIAIRYGVYGLQKDDKWLGTEEGNMLMIDMLGALNGK